MPYLETSIRQQLGLVVNSPSEEDIAAACSARGLQLQGGQLSPVQVKKPAAKKPVADASTAVADA